ncbi:MAG: hypothetical protein ABIR19_08670 [Ginsengibacter sp.]
MEDKPTAVEELFDSLKEYGEARVQLLKLIAINKVSGFASTVVSMIILIMILFTIIFCVSIGAALLIGNMIGEAYYGFFIVAGFYLIIGLILFSVRSSVLREPVSNKLISELVD